MENHFKKRDKLIAQNKDINRIFNERIEELDFPDYTSIDRTLDFYRYYEKDFNTYYDYLEKTLKDF